MSIVLYSAHWYMYNFSYIFILSSDRLSFQKLSGDGPPQREGATPSRTHPQPGLLPGAGRKRPGVRPGVGTQTLVPSTFQQWLPPGLLDLV